MRKLLFFATIMYSTFFYGQVGIGNTTPEAGLDISSTDQGVLIPRIALTSTADATSVVNPNGGALVVSTMVFNTATVADVVPGFYYWNGTIWIQIGSGSSTDLDWTISGNDIYNANTGNVGVGTTSPQSLFHIEGTSPFVPAVIDEDFESSTTTLPAPFTSFGDANWIITTAAGQFAPGGLVAAKSGNIANSQTSSLEVTVNITRASGGVLSFDYRTDAEGNYDELDFFIDGVDQTGGGLNSTFWSSLSYPLTTGPHTLRWTFRKDGSVSVGNDEAYIDNVLIKENGADPILRIADGNQADGNVLVSDAAGNATWKDSSSFGDDDWGYTFGSSLGGELYRTGKVVVGVNQRTNFDFHVKNGADAGTTVGVGSVENILDGLQESIYNQSLTPARHDFYDLGKDDMAGAQFYWQDVYAGSFVSLGGTTYNKTSRKTENKMKGLAEVMKLNPFIYKEESVSIGSRLTTDEENDLAIGFNAIELSKVIPEAVKSSDWVVIEEGKDLVKATTTSPKGIKYNQLIPVTVKAIQEQQAQIETLKIAVEELQEQNKLLIQMLRGKKS